MFRQMRRQEKQMDNERAIDILKKGSYGILSTLSENGYPYGVPVNYAYIDNAIYFHCATEGHKLDNIGSSDKVSFCVVAEEEIVPEKFSTKYKSVIVFGRATEVNDDEKLRALLAMIEKYSGSYLEKGRKYVENSADKTMVIRINVDYISGKEGK